MRKKVKTVEWNSFFTSSKTKAEIRTEIVFSNPTVNATTGVALAAMVVAGMQYIQSSHPILAEGLHMEAYDADVVPAMSAPTTGLVSNMSTVPVVSSPVTIDSESTTDWYEPLVHLIVSQGKPLMILVACWACLEIILKKPASATERIKWAVIGYLGLKYVPKVLSGL